MDRFLSTADAVLRTLYAKHHSATPHPARAEDRSPERPEDKVLSAALMRVNHVGEVCAQALYTAQAASTRNPALKAHFERAAHEETDHLAWTRQRLDELGDRVSVLNPLWYAGAFALGLVAGRISDAVSLGFVVETEKQVAEHLQSHLDRLPADDEASRAIVAQMKIDEERHAHEAQMAGAAELPPPAKALMRLAAKVMTRTAHYI